jgi:hypothetical protein
MPDRIAVRILVIVATMSLTQAVRAQNPLPADPQQTCTLTPAQFASWFAGGTVTPNGVVKPADSMNFPAQPALCDFYTWSWQMFLWLNSPTGSGRIFDSPLFYNVSDVDSAGFRTLTQNQAATARRFNLRSAQVGSKGKQVRTTATGGLQDIGQGQAGGNGVLMAQTNSLVFYEMQVNDVYAFFLTGQKGGQITATTFPTTQQQLNAIQIFAGKTFQDGNALTMELKSAWVVLGNLDPYQYITTTAAIPTYDMSNSTTWTATGSQQVQLALVGMHVVGSVQGHPEMIWATFEHKNNTPNASYTYTNINNQTITVPQSTAGTWLFAATNSTDPFNVERMSFKTPNIVAKQGQTNGPSNTLRLNPWGGVATSTANNTEILSLNNAVLSSLAAGDLRKNYVLGGATWTVGGVIPSNSSAPPVVGSTALANTTMETYQQGNTNNCFACHNTGGQTNGGGLSPLSHIYQQISPLP